MSWWLVAVACDFQVDFDPDVPTNPGVDPDDPDGVDEPDEPPVRIVVEAACAFDQVAGPSLEPLPVEPPINAPQWTIPAGEVDRIEFVTTTDRVVIERGGTTDVVVEPATGSVTAIGASHGVLRVQSLCKAGSCPPGTLTLTVPSEVDQIVGGALIGGVTIDAAATWDVDVLTLAGDIRVTGATRGVRAQSQAGSIQLDLPNAEVIDAVTLSGDIDVVGQAFQLCASAPFGRIDAGLDEVVEATFIPGFDGMTVDLVQRPTLVDFQASSGGEVRLTVPAGAYDIDVSAPAEGTTIANGIDVEGSADARIQGFNFFGPVIIEAR